MIDRIIGNALCLTVSPFKPRQKNNEHQKILIIKLWAVGESILTLPLIKNIRELYPKAEITILTRERNKAVYSLNKDINNVITLEKDSIRKHRKKYDLAFDCEPYLNISSLLSWFLGKETVGFSHGYRSKLYTHKVKYNDQQHVVKTYLNLLNPILDNEYNSNQNVPKNLVKVEYSKEDEQIVEKLLQENEENEDNDNNKQKINVGFCVGAAESAHSRMWPKEKFAELADFLIQKYDARIIFVGAPHEKERNQKVINLMKNNIHTLDTAGKTSLKQSFALIEKCDVFISNDTGPMHVAAAQGVPTIGLFGPNTPVRFGPYGEKNVAVYKPVLEKPCINVHKGEVPNCKDHDHMSNINVADVLSSVEKILQKKDHKSDIFKN